MQIRRATRHDLSEIVAIESNTLSPWSATTVGSELSEHSSRQVFVAERWFSCSCKYSNIVGWCSAATCFPEAELLKLTVKKAKRSQGIGQMLLEHLTNDLIEKGYATLFLEVRAKNLPALNLYLKNGFVETGLRRDYYKDPNDDALILHKKLQPELM